MTEGYAFLFAFLVGVAAGAAVVLTARWLLAWADALEAAEADVWAP